MKLGEKIQYCRKKAGMSQDALAERIGVSRQAISKWETGEAMPETNNLLILAKIFGVSVDWLISDDEEAVQGKGEKENYSKKYTAFFDSWTGFAGCVLKRYGWLAGVYLALCGLGVEFLGIMAKVALSLIIVSDVDVEQSIMDEFGNVIFTGGNDAFGVAKITQSAASGNPVSIFANVFIFIGIVMVTVGIVLAVYLKKIGRR